MFFLNQSVFTHDCKSYKLKFKVWFELSKGGVIILPKNLEKKLGCKYIQIHINLGDKTYEAIKKFASRNWMSASDVMRIAIDDWCSRKGLLIK